MLRFTLACTGAALIVSGVNVLNDAWSRLARVDSLPDESPICLPLNLSVQGVYSGYYKRSSDAFLDDQLRLVVAGSPSVEETRKALESFSAVLVFSDDSGRVISEQGVNATDFRERAGRLESALVAQRMAGDMR